MGRHVTDGVYTLYTVYTYATFRMRILKVAPDLYGFLHYTEGIWAPESVYSVAGGMASGAQQPRLLQQTLACTKLSFFETLQATAEMKTAQMLGSGVRYAEKRQYIVARTGAPDSDPPADKWAIKLLCTGCRKTFSASNPSRTGAQHKCPEPKVRACPTARM